MTFEFLAQKRGRLAAADVASALRAEKNDGGVGTRARAEGCEGFYVGGFLLFLLLFLVWLSLLVVVRFFTIAACFAL